jgi:AcrR family transcriptional regulator
MPKVVDVEARRVELAIAAARVIARNGICGTTMRDVAAEAGWTTGALTHWFSDKRELLRFTLQTSLAVRRGVPRDHLDPAAALEATLFAALPATEEARLHWIVTIAFCAQAAGDDDLAAIQRDAYRLFRDDVARLVAESGRAAGAAASRIEAERLIAALDGIALQALFDPASWSKKRQHTALTAALAAT